MKNKNKAIWGPRFGSSTSKKKTYSPSSLFEGRDSIRLMFRSKFATQERALSRAPGELACNENAKLAQLLF